MSGERVDSSSLLELMDEQGELIERYEKDLIIARRSLDRARTRWLVLQNYNTNASAKERAEAAMHLEGLAAYVEELENNIDGSHALIKAYKKARIDNMPVVRALGFVRRQAAKLQSPRSAEPLALGASKDAHAVDE